MNYNVSVSNDEFLSRNPTWGRVMKGSENEMLTKADIKEAERHLEGERAILEYIPNGRAGVPPGFKVLLLKRCCKIKSDGTYKVRWVTLGNLDDFEGETFAATASK